MSTSDLELLARYTRQGSEDAFAEVVRLHAGLVYAVALRVTRTPQLAEEVAQSVFLDLARSARNLRPDTVLAAWLYAVTRRTAASTMRGETRRLVREHTAYAMSAAEENAPPPADLEPLLDDAIDALAETDRAAIVLRFFEEKSLADVGAALGVSADAAQKRVSRAVEQMRGFFTHRGIATGTVAITALLAANTAKAVPAGLAASICATVHSSIPLTTATLIKAATMTSIQKTFFGLTLFAAVTAVGVALRQTHEVSQLREQLKTSQSSAPQTSSIQSETAGSTASRPAARTATTRANTKPTRSQLEAKVLSLAEIGVVKFGRTNMKHLFADASPEDIPRLLALVDEKMPNELRRRFHEAWFERWAAADAPAAFAYAVELDNRDAAYKAGPYSFIEPGGLSADLNLRISALGRVLENWMDQDPARAVMAVDAFTGRNREDACKALADSWVEKDPKAALNWAMNALPDDFNYRHAENTRKLARKWSETDPVEAWKWALALPDSEGKSLLVGDLAPAAANISPAEAAQEVAKMEPGDEQSRAAMRVAESWAKTDPRAASDWAAQFPDPGFRSMAMERIAAEWAIKDPAAATNWVQSLPAGDDQQDAWWAMSQKLANDHPELAADMVKNLTPGDRRSMTTDRIAMSWFKTDPAAARQWLQSIGHPEKWIQRLQKEATER